MFFKKETEQPQPRKGPRLGRKKRELARTKLIRAGAIGLLLLASLLPGRTDANPYSVVAGTSVYFATGNVMRSGVFPYWGATACDWNYLPLGTVFQLDDMVFRCMDTGSAVCGYHVDIFAPDVRTGRWFQQTYGVSHPITILEWGQNPDWWQWWMGCAY